MGIRARWPGFILRIITDGQSVPGFGVRGNLWFGNQGMRDYPVIVSLLTRSIRCFASTMTEQLRCIYLRERFLVNILKRFSFDLAYRNDLVTFRTWYVRKHHPY